MAASRCGGGSCSRAARACQQPAAAAPFSCARPGPAAAAAAGAALRTEYCSRLTSMGMASLMADWTLLLAAVDTDSSSERHMLAAVAVAVRWTLVGKKSRYDRTWPREGRQA